MHFRLISGAKHKSEYNFFVCLRLNSKIKKNVFNYIEFIRCPKNDRDFKYTVTYIEKILVGLLRMLSRFFFNVIPDFSSNFKNRKRLQQLVLIP